ncbi:MAG: RecX family transcriptional regulator [Rikenellaceae bacterium]|nr:RecX family transcriptional regulator [Rikenellaceae bacterium]
MLPPEIKYPKHNSSARKPKSKTPEQALATLMRLCARAEKCESDAHRLMHGWGLSTPDAQRILAQLVHDRFIDDSRYAEAFVREKLRLSGWGEYKIRAALQRKGIARELIDAALSEIECRDMATRLTEQLRRKARTTRSNSSYELRTKLIRYGIALGYNYETVLESVSQIIASSDLATTTEEEFFG